MPKILINVIQGFSARVRPEWTTVSHLVKTVLAPYNHDQVLINIENSSDRHCIRQSLNFLNREPSHVVLIGKILGGIRTWWMLRQHAAELARHLSVSAVFIDPHGWQVGDGVVGSYGRNRPLPYFPEFDAFSMVNFYQHNKWPCGAVFEGQDFNRELGKGADHWNVTDVESREAELICNEILRAVEHLFS